MRQERASRRDRGRDPACACSSVTATRRLSLHPDGRVRLAFKAPWNDGTHAVLLEPLDFVARLAALVPPPRFHMLRYHGVLAAHASVRVEVVPGREPPNPPPQLPLFEPAETMALRPGERPAAAERAT